jgi:hypothetical protein
MGAIKDHEYNPIPSQAEITLIHIEAALAFIVSSEELFGLK